MIGIDIDVRSDSAEGCETDVFVRTIDGPILTSENPALAIGLKVEAAISLLRDIESDFGMLELELGQDDNRVICGGLKRRLRELTDCLEEELTQHSLSMWSILETFGYMWSQDYKETLFFPALRADLMQASEGEITESEIAAEIVEMKFINKINEALEGESFEEKRESSI